MHRLLRANITVVHSRSLPEALSVFPELSHWKNTPYFIWCFAHYQLSKLCGVFMFSDMLSMVRKYERMSGRQSWSEEDMAKAVAAVVSGKMGYKLAARTYHIPRSTLQRRASKVRYQLPDDPKPLMGHYRRVFTDNQEKDLVGYIKSMEKYFMGVSRRDIRELAFQYAEDNNLNHPFDVNSRMAGEDWVRNFLKRNPELLNRSEKEYELEPVNFDQFYHFMCQLS
ncbi:chaetoglobosin A biosynthesis cluster protein C [Papilio machaon]|nr:chaetoglobosin A biosynthesis cluster protein C [Papilio machaon]